MTIIYDPPLRSYEGDGDSIVLACTECGHVWRAITFSRLEAYRSAERHQTITHDVKPDDAAAARRLWESRQAKAATTREHAAEANERVRERALADLARGWPTIA